MDIVVPLNKKVPLKPGKLFIEGRVRAGIEDEVDNFIISEVIVLELTKHPKN